jgi:hypothetical protein
MNIKKILILFVTSVVLISCVFTEELHIKNDGSGSYAFNMDMSQMMESMKGMSEKDSLKEPEVLDTIILFKDLLLENKDSIAKLDVEEKEVLEALEDFTMRMQVDEDKGKMMMTFGLDFKNISDLKNMQEKIAKAQSLSDKKKANKAMPSNSNIEYSFDGNTFKRIVTLKDLSKEKSDEFDKMINQSNSFLEGSNYRLVYHFERVIKHVSYKGAKISDDKKTLTIEMPMDTIINNPKLLEFEVKLKK